jgi:hypothetical protein
MGGGARLAAALILAACALKEGRALEDGKAPVVAFQAAGSPWHHAGIKKARSKTVDTSSHAAGGKKKPLRFHSAASERFGKMLRALKTGTRRSGGPSFESIDTDGNGCITAGEFNQIPGAGGPAFEDVAGLDGNTDCISKEELVKQLTTGSGGGTGAYGGACACVHAACASSCTHALAKITHIHTGCSTPPAKPNPIQVKTVDSTPLGIASVLYAKSSKVCVV